MSSTLAKSSALPVLLIEDEPAVMAYVRATLERSGYTVVCTESGVEGLRLLESEQFLGVVSDMRTPGGVDGAEPIGDAVPLADGELRLRGETPGAAVEDLGVADYAALLGSTRSPSNPGRQVRGLPLSADARAGVWTIRAGIVADGARHRRSSEAHESVFVGHLFHRRAANPESADRTADEVGQNAVTSISNPSPELSRYRCRRADS